MQRSCFAFQNLTLQLGSIANSSFIPKHTYPFLEQRILYLWQYRHWLDFPRCDPIIYTSWVLQYTFLRSRQFCFLMPWLSFSYWSFQHIQLHRLHLRILLLWGIGKKTCLNPTLLTCFSMPAAEIKQEKERTLGFLNFISVSSSKWKFIFLHTIVMR